MQETFSFSKRNKFQFKNNKKKTKLKKKGLK